MNAQVLARGLVTGFVGATVIAVFFFVTDLLFATPLATPAFMAQVLLDAPGAAGVPAYTVLHYTSFLVMGMATSWALDSLDVNAPVLIGLALGGMLFVFIFYGSVLFNGLDVVDEVGWPIALLGNLLAGLAMVFTARRGAGKRDLWNDRLLAIPWVSEGLLLGLTTSALVAAWMLLVDVLVAEPFFTAGALGSALVLSARDMSEVVINGATILGYTLYHVIVFTTITMIVSYGSSRVRDLPSVLIAGILLFAVFEAFTVGLIALVAAYLLGSTAWWGLLGGNLLASAWIVWHVARKHPEVSVLLRRVELSSEAR